MLRKLHKLAAVSPADWAGFLFLVLLSSALRAALTMLPLQRVASRLLKPGRFILFRASYDASRLAAVADLAARLTFGPGRCLGRSLLLLWLLKARGEPVELHVGVSRESNRFQSHAWIRVRETLVGDTPELIDRYSCVLRLP